VHLLLGVIRRFPILIIIAVIAVGGIVFREHLAGAAAELRVGDCINLPAQLGDVSDVQHRPCGEAHDGEVFHLFKIPSADVGGPRSLPTEAELDAILASECLPAFDRYTGLQHATAYEFGFGSFSPTRQGWDSGDREVSCYLGRVDGAPLTISMRAAAP
jgi:hypothetical protein